MVTVRHAAPAALILLSIAGTQAGCMLRYEVIPSDIAKVCSLEREGSTRVRVFRPVSGSGRLPTINFQSSESLSFGRSDGSRETADVWTFGVGRGRTLFVRKQDGKEIALYEPRCTALSISGRDDTSPGGNTNRAPEMVEVAWKDVASIEVRRAQGPRTFWMIVGVAAALGVLIASSSSSR